MRWKLLGRTDTTAAAAVHDRARTWSAAENMALLAAAGGRTNANSAAFWEDTCAAHPLLTARGPVRGHMLSCIITLSLQAYDPLQVAMLARLRANLCVAVITAIRLSSV